MRTIDLVANSEPAPPHVFDMRRALEIARKTRTERARKACDLQTYVVGSRIIPASAGRNADRPRRRAETRVG
jgi:hypothetical protein